MLTALKVQPALPLHLSIEDISNNFSPYSAWECNGGQWPGDKEFKVKFANGTSTTAEVRAIPQYSSGPFIYEDGQQVYNRLCMPHTQEELKSIAKQDMKLLQNLPSFETSSASAGSQSPLPSGYPKPVIRADDNSVSGYYLDGPDFKDIAVLFIPTFGPMDNQQFADTATKFVKGAKADGKKRNDRLRFRSVQDFLPERGNIHHDSVPRSRSDGSNRTGAFSCRSVRQEHRHQNLATPIYGYAEPDFQVPILGGGFLDLMRSWVARSHLLWLLINSRWSLFRRIQSVGMDLSSRIRRSSHLLWRISF